jgi:glycosyltransferase involved in cell wall biosynthesis
MNISPNDTPTISTGDPPMKSGEAPRRAARAAREPMGAGARRVLYLTYDGLTDQLGRSQILPYLTRLAMRGHRIVVISCEKTERLLADGEAVDDICRRAGIDWHPLRYHKQPPVISGIIDIVQMQRRAAGLFRREQLDLVHCRSYMASLVGHSLKRRFGVPFLFDMRGFWADERIERGLWPTGNPLYRLAYRFFKRREAEFFRDADAIVSLTNSGRQLIESWPDPRRPKGPISVIPCCVDLALFDPAGGRARARGRERFGMPDDQPVLLYVGSVGPGYRTDAMFELFRAFRANRPTARYLFVTNNSRAEILARARPSAIGPSEIITVAGRRDEMPELIAAGDIGVSIIEPSFAAKASCPTKVGEMLAMGVPVIANSGVGDTAELIGESGAGAVLDRLDHESLAAAIAKVEALGLTREQIRAVARRYLSLEDGVERYDGIYRSMRATHR